MLSTCNFQANALYLWAAAGGVVAVDPPDLSCRSPGEWALSSAGDSCLRLWEPRLSGVGLREWSEFSGECGEKPRPNLRLRLPPVSSLQVQLHVIPIIAHFVYYIITQQRVFGWLRPRFFPVKKPSKRQVLILKYKLPYYFTTRCQK